MVACEQALRGTLAAGHEKEGQLATRSPEFANLQQKRLCEMQNGRDDNSNAIITLGLCFSNYVCLHSQSILLHADWWKSDSSVVGELVLAG